MTDFAGSNLVFTSTSTFSAADPQKIKSNLVSAALSGIVINQNGSISTTISDDTNLPAKTIRVTDTTGFPVSGTLRYGTDTIAYANKTGNTFTGCSTVDAITGESFQSEVLTRGNKVYSTREDGYLDLEDNWIFQEWRFPLKYPRETTDPNGENRRMVIPKFCGIQVETAVEVGYSAVAALDWRVDYLRPGTGWVGLAQGTEVGAPHDGEHVWFDINFDPIDIESTWQHRFRFGVRSRTFQGVTDVDGVPQPLSTEVNHSNGVITIDGNSYTVVDEISPAPLQPGKQYLFDNDGTPGILVMQYGSKKVYYGRQEGVRKVWYTTPTPFIANDLHVRGNDGVEKITDDGSSVALKFRILSLVGDSGRDSFANNYQNNVYSNDVTNLSPDLKDAFWLSKPNPSPFGVESLYFDIRSGNDPSVVDRILIDPVTPGVQFHIYYSNDPAPGTTVDEWDQLLWTRVNRTFQLRRREHIALPEPIKAKYIKVEFCKLIPRYYAPGVLQEPMVYRKHPKWVLDYFLAQYERQRLESYRSSSQITLVYDAFDLLFNYYLDDIRADNPDLPQTVLASEAESLLKPILDDANDEINKVDSVTAQKISTVFQPFLQNPFYQGRFDQILRTYARPADGTNYSTETITLSGTNTNEVISLDQDDLTIEKEFPATSFYLECRHFYRTTQAEFEEDRAYFVGLKEISFTRDHYDQRFDHPIYVETAGDNVNIERNDFEPVDLVWATYSDSS